MTAPNLVSYSLQVAVLIGVCAPLPRALGLRSPSLQYAFWRGLLAVCVLLPALEPWRHEEMTFVPAGSGAGLATAAVFGQAAPTAGGPFVPVGAIASAAGILLLAGIGARLAWLSAGEQRLRWMRDDATEPATGFADLQQMIGVAADIRWSRDVRHPVTFGSLRPVVLLPVVLRDAGESARRAVVAHELHHVKRRDWPIVIVEELVRSVFWFHPAMWWLVSRVQLARETVVDELSILTTNARRAYLDTLLAFADDTGLASTPAFSARRHLFHRVMLLSKEGSMSSSKIAFGSCALVAALAIGSWGVAYAFPLSTTVVSPVGDSAHDQNLSADRNLSADQSTTPQTRTTPGQLAPPPPPPPPPTRDMPESFRNTLERLHPIHIGGNIKAPTKTKDVRPAYPEDAMASKVQGTVIVEAIIDAAGNVADTRIVSGVPELNDAAQKAVSQWQFTPTLLNGEPTAVICTVTVTFRVQ
jgi:TonB family protein